MKLAVAGGTGMVGRFVVAQARGRGHDVVVLSRTKGVDLLTGDGLDQALADVDTVVDVANVSTISAGRSTAFFSTSTANLLAAGHRAGVRHHVALSVVGIDRVGFGYYRGKQAQERLIEAGPVPWTILRATQFHEFAAQVLRRTSGAVVSVPRMRTATVAASEVAEHLVRLATGSPVGRAPELAGPEVHELTDLVRRELRRTGARRLVVPVRQPGKVGRLMATDGLLPTGVHDTGVQTYREWAAARPGTS